MQSCVESDSPNCSLKSLGKRDNQVSHTTRGRQCLLHSTRCNVAHTREPVLRDRDHSSSGASTTTPTTANNLKTHLTPRTTPLTSWPSTSAEVRCRSNCFSQTSSLAVTFEAISTYFPPPVNKHRTKETSCRAMTLAKATPYSTSI